MQRVTANESAPVRDESMSSGEQAQAKMGALDDETAALARLAAVIAVGTEPRLRLAMSDAVQAEVRPEWVEEVILQSYLFAGFPRALNAAREWRRASKRPAPVRDAGMDYERAREWRIQGERTCELVYGAFYERLRHNIRDLHPALDAWMIVDGYGKVLSRDGLDLKRRELCIVAVCAASEQDRQLHSHLHGARNAGATVAEVSGALGVADEFLEPDAQRRLRLLWARVQGK